MTRILANLLITLVACAFVGTYENKPDILSLQTVEDVERLIYDLRMAQSIEENMPAPDDEVVIVDIDSRSIERIESWPWRRDRLAGLLEKLDDYYGVRLIVFPDSLAESSDQTRAVIGDLKERFYYDNAIQKAIEQIEPEYDFDQRLRDTIDGRPVILGFTFDDTERRSGSLPSILDLYDVESGSGYSSSSLRDLTPGWPVYQGYFASDGFFFDRAISSGYALLQPDVDGLIRSYSMIAKHNNQNYLSLPAEVLRYNENIFNPQNFYASTGASGLGQAIKSFGPQNRQAPIDRMGRMLLGYQGGGADSSGFRYYSAYDLMEEQVEPGQLEGKIAFIGSSSEEVNDLWNTPVAARVPGVELHALAFRNLRDQSMMVRSQSAALMENIIMVALTVALSFVFVRLRVLPTLVVGAGLMALTIYVNYNILWLGSNEVYRLAPFLVVLLTLMVTNLISGFMVEYQAKKKVEGVLNQYIPPELAKEVNASKKGFSMEGEIREMTILFSDVRGFTTISEGLDPHDLTKLMNQMLTAMSYEIHHSKGTIDKYIGDAVMAFWNAPLDDRDHALNAVRGAVGMQRAMAKLSKELMEKGMPELKMGIGLNTGKACVGNMGSKIRLSYTVMGDTVNLASRLEGITKQYGVDIIVGERTFELTQEHYLYRPVDAVRVKGKNEAVMIYSPIAERRSATEKMTQLYEMSNQYWELYNNRGFGDMVAIIEQLKALYPDDGLLEIYRNKAQRLLDAPPPDDWEAVTNFDTK